MTGKIQFTCPQCGFRLGDRRDYNSLIKSMLENYSKEVQTLIKSMSKKIIKALPSENNINLYFFLLRIQYNKTDEFVIKQSIDQYLYNEYHMKGKGFAYLTAMIVNINKNKDKTAQYEKERLGSIPPIRNINKEDK